MTNVKRKLLLSCTLLPLILGLPASAQYSNDWFKVSGGGGRSIGGAYSVTGTIGQQDAGGPMTGSHFSLKGGFWSLIVPVQRPGQPYLSLAVYGKSAVLSWSDTTASFVLEHESDLSATNAWSPVGGSVVTVDGFNFVTNAIVLGNNFFRLRSP